MMTNWENVHEEERHGLTITLWAAPETETPDWCFESEDERRHLLERIDSGDLLWFVARVTASKNGIELASDYLGECCYESVADFVRHSGYYADMVQTVVSEALTAIEDLQTH